MKMYILRSLVLFLTATCAASASKTESLLEKLKTTVQDLKATTPTFAIEKSVEPIFDPEHNFSEEELLSIAKTVKNSYQKAMGKDIELPELENFISELVTELKDWNISGIGFSRHTSANCIWGKENFTAQLIFKNSADDFSEHKINFNYNLLGFTCEFLYRFDMIFFSGDALSRHDVCERLKFDSGISFGWRLPITLPIRLLQEEYAIWNAQAEHQFNNNTRGLPENKKNRLYAQYTRESQGTARYPLCTVGVTLLPLAEKKGTFIIAHCGFGATGCMPTISPFSLNSMNFALVPASN